MKEIVILEAMSLAKPERRETRKCLITKLQSFLQRGIARLEKPSYICNAKLRTSFVQDELIASARHNRAFFMPIHKRLRLLFPDKCTLAHLSEYACVVWRLMGNNSPFCCITPNYTQQMKQTVALPAQKAKQSLFIDRAIRAWKLYCRWLIITTIAAPNPMQEGGEL